ncbi:MAG: thioredoxin family protein [Thermoflexales bacterium]|nr:thioredoxin family protein [Thermoflexales bacterium]
MKARQAFNPGKAIWGVFALALLVACSAPEAAPRPIATINPNLTTFETSAVEFEAEAQVSGPLTFIEFYAEWCGVCKRTAPLFARLREEFGDKVAFLSYDVDQPGSAEFVRQYRVRGVPTYVLLGGSQVIARITGPFDYETMQARLRKYAQP